MPEQDSSENREVFSPRRPAYCIFLLMWLALIFSTSCTVIRPQEFFAMIQRYVFLSEGAIEHFKVFWGLSWFAIVKGWHATEFGILLFLCVRAIGWWTGRIDKRSVFWSMLFCIAFAIGDEWHQSFVPDRFGTVTDVLIDCLGVCVVGAILLKRRQVTMK